MYVIHVFGAATTTGHSFLNNTSLLDELNGSYQILSYSRSTPDHSYVDLLSPDSFLPKFCSTDDHILISFAPLVLFAPFLSQVFKANPLFAQCVSCVCALSSTSAEVKRFSFNYFDKSLSLALLNAEQCLVASCSDHSVHSLVIRPTMIYGNAGPYSDTNINFLLSLLRRSPVLLLPTNSGLRQPIHCTQLSEVVTRSVLSLLSTHTPINATNISVGGDSTISYREMLLSLQASAPARDSARACLVITLPSRLFVLLAAPFALFSFKLFEASLRIFADLSGFHTSSSITGNAPKQFPVQ